MYQGYGTGPHIVGIILFSLAWLFALAGWIIFLVAIWRGMRAHESIADSLRHLVQQRNDAGHPGGPQP